MLTCCLQGCCVPQAGDWTLWVVALHDVVAVCSLTETRTLALCFQNSEAALSALDKSPHKGPDWTQKGRRSRMYCVLTAMRALTSSDSLVTGLL